MVPATENKGILKESKRLFQSPNHADLSLDTRVAKILNSFLKHKSLSFQFSILPAE